MSKCFLCGAETPLHVNQQPICPKCDEARINRQIERGDNILRQVQRERSEGAH